MDSAQDLALVRSRTREDKPGGSLGGVSQEGKIPRRREHLLQGGRVPCRVVEKLPAVPGHCPYLAGAKPVQFTDPVVVPRCGHGRPAEPPSSGVASGGLR